MPATDYKGKPITTEQIAGMRRFNHNDTPRKLVREDTLRLTYEIDETWREAHEEDGDIYALILPSDFHTVTYLPVVGDIITCAKQYASDIGGGSLLKRFQVVRIDREINQDVTQFCLYLMVKVIPVESTDAPAALLPGMYQELSEKSGTNNLLYLCVKHGLYLQMYKGRFLVALGDIIGLGSSLTKAIEHWCQEVERRGLVEKGKD